MLGFSKSSTALVGVFLAAGAADAEIVVGKATIAYGALLVEGTATAGSQVTLDQQFSTAVKAGAFKFAIASYHPGDCVVSLKSNASGDAAKSAVVAGCAPRSLVPRGNWASRNAYAGRRPGD